MRAHYEMAVGCVRRSTATHDNGTAKYLSRAAAKHAAYLTGSRRLFMKLVILGTHARRLTDKHAHMLHVEQMVCRHTRLCIIRRGGSVVVVRLYLSFLIHFSARHFWGCSRANELNRGGRVPLGGSGQLKPIDTLTADKE